MKLDFKYDYVPEGQDEPDKFGRWSITAYIYANIKRSAPEYEWTKKTFLPIPICVIHKNDNQDHYKYKTSLCCMDDPGNTGLTHRNFFSNDLEELKQTIRDQISKMKLIFEHIKP